MVKKKKKNERKEIIYKHSWHSTLYPINIAEVMVPLTSALYAPGKLTNTETVLVDIGTGYFAKRTLEEAQDYLQRKCELLQKNLAQIQDVLDAKRQSMQSVNMVLNVTSFFFFYNYYYFI